MKNPVHIMLFLIALAVVVLVSAFGGFYIGGLRSPDTVRSAEASR